MGVRIRLLTWTLLLPQCHMQPISSTAAQLPDSVTIYEVGSQQLGLCTCMHCLRLCFDPSPTVRHVVTLCCSSQWSNMPPGPV